MVLDTGYNIDIICASIGVGYENYVAQKQRDGKDPNKAEPTQEEMLAMIERVRNERKNNHP